METRDVNSLPEAMRKDALKFAAIRGKLKKNPDYFQTPEGLSDYTWLLLTKARMEFEYLNSTTPDHLKR